MSKRGASENGASQCIAAPVCSYRLPILRNQLPLLAPAFFGAISQGANCDDVTGISVRSSRGFYVREDGTSHSSIGHLSLPRSSAHHSLHIIRRSRKFSPASSASPKHRAARSIQAKAEAMASLPIRVARDVACGRIQVLGRNFGSGEKVVEIIVVGDVVGRGSVPGSEELGAGGFEQGAGVGFPSRFLLLFGIGYPPFSTHSPGITSVDHEVSRQG